MIARPAIPLSFEPRQPDALKTALDRQAQELDKFFRNADNQIVPRPGVSGLATRNIGATFDAITRVAPRDGETVTVELPKIDRRFAGRRCIVLRKNTLGTIVITPLDSTINGEAALQMNAYPHFVEVLSDGEAYFTDLYEAAAP